MASELAPSGDEYVISEQPAGQPVVNFLCNDEYGLLISDALGGYSLDASGQLLTAVGDAQTLSDRPGRIIYLRDHDTGEFWLLTPTGELDPLRRYQARHGLGYSIFETEANGVGVNAKVFVPPSDPVELWELKITNLRKTKRRLSLYLVMEWAGLFDYCRAVGNSLIATSRHQSELAGFVALNHQLDSFETDPMSFFGRGRGYARPRALEDGRLNRSQGALMGNGIAVCEKKLTLGAGATFELAATVGLVTSPRPIEKAKRLSAHWAVAKNRHIAFEGLTTNWRELTARHLIKTPDERLNARYNALASYQGHLANRWPQLTSYGQHPVFRPLTTEQFTHQIQLGLLDAPKLAEERLTQVLERQYKDGGVVGEWATEPSADQPATSEATIGLLGATVAFLHETGQLSWLKTHYPFLDGGNGSALEHVNRALRWLEAQLSSRHLLDQATESVLLSAKMVEMLQQIIPMLEAEGDHQQARHLLGLTEKMRAAINKQWAGHSYPREVSPTKIGFKANKYHQIDLQTQIWAIISRAAEPKRALALLTTIKKQLATRHGVTDFTPAYATVETRNPLTFDRPGTGQNGAISTQHNVLLAAAVADQVGGDNLPGVLASEDFWLPDSITLSGQPTVCFGSPVALLFQKLILENLAGITATLGGLRVNPCLPRDWRLIEVNRMFRGAEYHIRVHNPLRVGKGVERIIVDGSRLTGNVIRPFRAGSHIVEVFLG